MKKFFPAYCLQYKMTYFFVGMMTFVFLTSISMLSRFPFPQFLLMEIIGLLIFSFSSLAGFLIDRQGIIVEGEKIFYRHYRITEIPVYNISQIVLLPSSYPMVGRMDSPEKREYTLAVEEAKAYSMILMNCRISNLGNYSYSGSNHFISEERSSFMGKAAFNAELLGYLLSKNPSINCVRIDRCGVNTFR